MIQTEKCIDIIHIRKILQSEVQLSPSVTLYIHFNKKVILTNIIFKIAQ